MSNDRTEEYILLLEKVAESAGAYKAAYCGGERPIFGLSSLMAAMFIALEDLEKREKSIPPEEAEPGVWYDNALHGKMLCCGTTGGGWLPGFACRTPEGSTRIKSLAAPVHLFKSGVQGWDPVEVAPGKIVEAPF
jgi:hypothetical protein